MYAKLLWVYHFKKQRFMRQWSVWPQDMLRISPGNVECPLGCSLLLEIHTIHTYWCWECCSYPVYSKIKSLNHDWKATGIFCLKKLYLFPFIPVWMDTDTQVLMFWLVGDSPVPYQGFDRNHHNHKNQSRQYTVFWPKCQLPFYGSRVMPGEKVKLVLVKIS